MNIMMNIITPISSPMRNSAMKNNVNEMIMGENIPPIMPAINRNIPFFTPSNRAINTPIKNPVKNNN